MADSTKMRQFLNVIWNDRYGSSFDDWVQLQRDDDVSWRSIEGEIARRVGVQVSHVSLIQWFKGDREPAA